MAPPSAGNFLKPNEEEWREAFNRLSERFPTVPGKRVAQALRQHGGHAGGAAAVLRDMTGFAVKEADPDDVEHVSTLLSSPPMFKHACKEQFKKFDVNKDGVLEWEEVKQLVHNLYDEFGLQTPAEGALMAFFYATDENQDGVLSEREFRKFFEMYLRYAFFDHLKLRQMVEKGQAIIEGRAVNNATAPAPARDESENRPQPQSHVSSPSDKEEAAPSPQVQVREEAPSPKVGRRSPDGRHREKRRHREERERESAPVVDICEESFATTMRCVAANGVAYRSSPDFQNRTDTIANRGENIKVLETWIRTPDGWLPVTDQQGRTLVEKTSGDVDSRSDHHKKHVSIREQRDESSRRPKQSPSHQAVSAEGGGSLRANEEEWRPVFDRLTERFPDISQDKIVQALRENDGHAGKAASMLRQL